MYLESLKRKMKNKQVHYLQYLALFMYFSTQQLEERGWTKSLIKKFLPQPDDVQYFRYGCAYFYGHVHVKNIEATEEFLQLQAKALKRRETGKTVTEKRKKEYLDYLENRMPVRVREVQEEELIKEACDSYNRHQRDRAWRRYERGFGDDDFTTFEADQNSDQHFLDRIIVNYIRHDLTSYDNLLSSTHGKLAKEEAIQIIRRRVFVAIAETYPNYCEEIKRQCTERNIPFPETVNYEIGEQMCLFQMEVIT